MNHTAQLGAAARANIHHRTHCGSCTCKTAEHTSHGVTYTLTYQLLIAVVLGLGDVVGYHRCQKGVDAAKASQSKTRDNSLLEHSHPVDASQFYARISEERHRKTGWDVTDNHLVAQSEWQ